MQLFLVLLLAVFVNSSCSQSTDDQTTGGVDVTRLGPLRFAVQNVIAGDLSEPLTLPNQSKFKVMTFEYRVNDQTALVIGMPVQGTLPPTQRCTLTQQLTSDQVAEALKIISALQLCQEKARPGTVIMANAASETSAAATGYVSALTVQGYGTSASFPIYEEEDVTGICNDAPVLLVVQDLLKQIDFAPSMSCTPL